MVAKTNGWIAAKRIQKMTLGRSMLGGERVGDEGEG